MLKEDAKAGDALAGELRQPGAEWEDWHGSDSAAFEQPWKEKLKVRAPSTLERPAIPAPKPEMPGEAEHEHPQAPGGGSQRKNVLRRRRNQPHGPGRQPLLRLLPLQQQLQRRHEGLVHPG